MDRLRHELVKTGIVGFSVFLPLGHDAKILASSRFALFSAGD